MIDEVCLCKCVSNRGACTAVAVLMAQVPQINGEVVEFVVAQISMSQQTAEQRESESSLPACSLKNTRTCFIMATFIK